MGHGAEDCNFQKRKHEVIEVTDVKEEPSPCKHEMMDTHGIPFPLRSQLPVDIWEGNKVETHKIDSMLSSLDATLWQYSMRGWQDIKELMSREQDSFKYYHMKCDGSGYFGFFCVCKECSRCVSICWKKGDDESILSIERHKLRAYFRYGTRGCNKQRKV